MRRVPSLTLGGALAVLDHSHHKLIVRLDKLLGGVILAAGAGAGLASVGIPALAPLNAFAAVWAWVDQKNEAASLLREVSDAVTARLNGTRGYERHQLIAVAHTVIAICAYFESFREHIDKNLYKSLEITDREKIALATGRWPQDILESLYSSEIPAPSSVRGYEENIKAVEDWMSRFSEVFEHFTRGLNASERITFPWPVILHGAVDRYRSHYLTLAATVPEFMVWAALGEHAATRYTIIDLNTDLTSALEANRGALARVETLLGLTAGSGEVVDLCAVVERANRGVLNEPIVPLDAERHGTSVEFPSVGQIYVNPRYRIAAADHNTRASDEAWWEKQEPHADLDLTLTAYVTAADATRFPLLILGEPGAGKSLLTKVFAARLPAPAYTVVRVPLRRVGANMPIMNQVQEALDIATHKRVDWWRLVEQSRDTVRVVMLDGLDELLRATNNDRSGYLQEVMEFQRIEAEQQRPVVVVVTSRTVVADRVAIPDGTTLIKLDHFNKADIEEWLERWHEVNSSSIESGKMRELTLATALQQRHLAQQPLLLLMLALYSADPEFPELGPDLSTANLYQHLFDNFTRREIAKKSEQNLLVNELQRQIRDQLERLSIAALAMFNRGRQDVTDVELGEDLAALSESSVTRSHLEVGQRLIGEFFFVHVAEARQSGASGQSTDPSAIIARNQAVYRSYEFLHATFGEYLVAGKTVNELVDIAETALAGSRGPRDPDDDFLFALLSHQPLAAHRPIVSFAIQIFANFNQKEQRHALEVLEILIETFRRRHGSDRYTSYRPTDIDRVRQLATYSVNLVTLRLALEPNNARVPLSVMLRHPNDTLREWRMILNLWRSGLDTDGFLAVLASFDSIGDCVRYSDIGETPSVPGIADLRYSLLVDDRQLEERLRYGMAIKDRFLFNNNRGDDWFDVMASWLIPKIVGIPGPDPLLIPPKPDTPKESIASIVRLTTTLLRFRKSSTFEV